MEKHKVFLLLGGFLAMIFFLLSKLTYGYGFLCTFGMAVGGAIGGYGLLWWPVAQLKWRRLAALMRKWIYLGLICLTISFAVIEGLIIVHSEGEAYHGNYLVVLGAGLYGDQPSLSLIARLETAQAYLADHPQSAAILSGGQGPGESISEAQAMANYLMERDIASERLYLEDQSTNTRENLANSQKILAILGAKQEELAIVSNDFHLYRAKALAAQLGLPAVTLSAPTPDLPFLAPSLYLREYFAVCKMYLQTALGDSRMVN